MKTDLDNLMARDQIDALWISGALSHNPDMVYFTGIHHVTQADLFKLRGQPPVMFYLSDMEREEAALTGLEVHAYDELRPLNTYLDRYQGDQCAAQAARTSEVLKDLGLHRGRVAVSGRGDISTVLALLSQLKPLLPEVDFFSSFKNSAIQYACMTKDDYEIDRIREMGRITTQVVARTAEFLTSQPVNGEQLINENGQPLRIADVKQRMRVWLAELGADSPEENVFAIGRDAGIPHSSGNPQDIITLGKPIVFDIFPCESGGGYFYDFTRTWCLGSAPDKVSQLHDQVLSIHRMILNEIKPNTLFKDYQTRTCQLFADLGHVTIDEDYNAVEGYIHSVGHGIGLNVHENPFSGVGSTPNDRLLPGVVFTIEPGLYYPSKGMGVRIEDTLVVNHNGEIEVLASYPYDLVLPMKG